MKARVLSFIILISTVSTICGCGGDTPPEKTVGSITFVITEENTPETLSGVSIQLFSDDDTSVTPADRTDNSGRCTFSNIPIGSYHMNLSKPGYESKEGLSLRINGGDNPSKELSLRRITTELTVAPSVLDFGGNESVVQKAFSLVNPNYVDLTWAVLDTDVSWIVSVCDKDGKKNGTIKYNQEVAMSVTIDRDKLTSGNNESTIVILSDSGRAELKVKAIGADRRTPTTNMLEVDADMTKALFKGEVISVGAPEYTERGFVYSTSSIPADAKTGFTTVAAQMNSEKTFSVSVTGLEKGTTYFVRAYGKNTIGLQFSSNELSFTTIASKTAVSTSAVTQTDVVNGKAQFNGEITEVGSPVYSEKGFCYNKNGEPTINDTKVTVSGTSGGAYSYSCAGLSSNTTYYVKAYAIQSGKVLYGTAVTFSTDLSKTSVTTSQATDVKSSSATLNGAIAKVGSPAYTEKGFCVSQTESYPTINSTKYKVSDAGGAGNFSYPLTGLSYGERYYFRTYAIQNGEAVYGEPLSFTTSYTKAEVTTSDVNGIGYHTLTFNGQVTDIGEPKITERGFCYSGTYDYPSISHSKVKVAGTSSGTFNVKIDDLEEDTKYYVRAYVIQDGNVLYGNVKNAKTYLEPIVATGPAINVNLSSNGLYWQATMQGAFYDGEPGVTEAGFVYGFYDNPTVNNYNCTKVKYDSINKESNGAYKFTRTLTNLNGYKTYYFRAYVSNSVGVTYGETYSFDTY